MAKKQLRKGRKPKKPCASCGIKSTATFISKDNIKKVAFAINFCDACGKIAKKQSNDNYEFYKI